MRDVFRQKFLHPALVGAIWAISNPASAEFGVQGVEEGTLSAPEVQRDFFNEPATLSRMLQAIDQHILFGDPTFDVTHQFGIAPTYYGKVSLYPDTVSASLPFYTFEINHATGDVGVLAGPSFSLTPPGLKNRVDVFGVSLQQRLNSRTAIDVTLEVQVLGLRSATNAKETKAFYRLYSFLEKVALFNLLSGATFSSP